MKVRINIMALAFIAYLMALGALCFMRGDTMPDVSVVWWGIPADKVAHFLMFVPFTPLAYLTFRKKKSQFWKKGLLLTCLAAIGFALAYLTEIIQGRLKYRAYEVEDFHFDGYGLALGYLIVAIALLIKKSRK